MKVDNYPGFFGIGIYEPKFSENIGTLWRHAYLYNASFVFTIGAKYKRQATETNKATRHIPLLHYDDFNNCKENMPKNSEFVAVELSDNATCLSKFTHPKNGVYLLGAEATGIPKEILSEFKKVVQIYTPRPQSMNVSTSGTLVMYDRTIKLRNK